MSIQRIVIPEQFRDRPFAAGFGAAVQAKFDSKPQSMEIDFSNCVFIDPLPMLGLLCNVYEWTNAVQSHELLIDLGSARTESGFGDSPSRSKLFLAKHGFLRALANLCKSIAYKYESGLEGYPTSFLGERVSDLEQSIEMSTNCKLFYEADPACAPIFCRFESDPLTTASHFVDDVVQIMDAKIFRARQSEFRHRDGALVRARQVITELVVNALEHAYPENYKGPIVFYARRRQLHDSLREDQYNRKNVETSSHAPLISFVQSASTNYLELFLCDVGKGLTASANDWLEKAPDEITKKEIASILSTGKRHSDHRVRRRLLSLVFRRPVSRHGRGDMSVTGFRSNVTGLYHVNTVLSRHTDRSRIYMAPEWTASQHPRPENYNGGPQDVCFETVGVDESTYPRGSYFHFALHLAQELELGKEWFIPKQSAHELPRLRAVFSGSSSSVERETEVFDLRTLLAGTTEHPAMSQQVISKMFSDYLGKNGNVAIVRMSREFRKNLTDEIVNKWAAASEQRDMQSTLVFCDLSQAQAVLLAAHLERFHPDRAFKGKTQNGYLRVVILSEDIVACGLNLVFVPETSRPVFRMDAHAPDVKFLALVLNVIRYQDSHDFWMKVSQSKNRLLIEDVRWGDNEDHANIRLPVYIDYSLAVQDRELAKIVRRSLRRALAAFRGLRAIAIDDLVKPDLEDAQRWTHRAIDSTDSPGDLFVISSVVTGTTVTRAARQRGVGAEATLACFMPNADPPQTLPADVYSALEWLPTSTGNKTRDGFNWERIPGTPFVRPYIETGVGGRVALVRPVARILDERVPGVHSRPSVAESYIEWHRERLLRTGHWSIDRRHGLIEIDHARALQISAESGLGFYRWLAQELDQRSKIMPAPLLVYPPGRLNAIMVRHLVKTALDINKWQILPVNFLPDIGDGLKQITPLSLDQIKRSSAARAGGTGFFLDIGFVGNRTFRHTKRQLISVGLKSVIGLGLVNRTSSPTLPEEVATEREDVICYWRIDVPTLDDERSCPICKSSDSLKALRERALGYQPTLVQCIDRIRRDWQLSDPSMTWWDHGVEPLVFETPLRKKFGFKPPPPSEQPALESNAQGQLSLITSSGEPLPEKEHGRQWWPSDEVAWCWVWLQNSTQAAAYAIEIARTQASPDYPIRFAMKLVQEGGRGKHAVAIEVIASYLLLCAHDLNISVREQCARLLVSYLATLERIRPLVSEAGASEKLRWLRQLAVLAIASLDIESKTLVRDSVMKALFEVQLDNQETQVAFMALTLDEPSFSKGRNGKWDEEITQQIRRLMDANHKREASHLAWNRLSITVAERPLKDQFEDALRFFGPEQQHGEAVQEIQKATAFFENDSGETRPHFSPEDYSTGWKRMIGAINRAHSIICQGWRGHSNNNIEQPRVADLFGAICSIDDELIRKLFAFAQRQFNPGKKNEDTAEARRLIDECRTAFHSAMIRIDSMQPNVAIRKVATEIAQLTSVTEKDAQGSSPFRVETQIGNWRAPDGMRYVLLGIELKEFILQLCKEALRYARDQAVPPPCEFSNLEGALARIWIIVHARPDGNVDISIWNQSERESNVRDFEIVRDNMAPVHRRIGTQVERLTPKLGDQTWFLTRITLFWIPGGTS